MILGMTGVADCSPGFAAVMVMGMPPYFGAPMVLDRNSISDAPSGCCDANRTAAGRLLYPIEALEEVAGNLSPVDGDIGPGDKPALVARQEDDDVGDLVDLRAARDRTIGVVVLGLLRHRAELCRPRREHLRVATCGAHRVDADAVATE